MNVAVRKADDLGRLNDERRLRSHPDRAAPLDDEMVRNDPTCVGRETLGEVGDRRSLDGPWCRQFRVDEGGAGKPNSPQNFGQCIHVERRPISFVMPDAAHETPIR